MKNKGSSDLSDIVKNKQVNIEGGESMFRIVITLFITVLLLSACGSKDFAYSGESNNWQADLKVHQSSGFEKQGLLLKFQGEDVKSIGPITYKVDSVGSFGGTRDKLQENGTVEDYSEANTTNAQVSEHTEVEVTVEWNGKTETFKLTKK
ncbi:MULTISPECIES: hypothetical protein [Sutcliffiella]|uniref:hypothetical protein n=1 Tax=Sutcliffiella TaxID=2837511 RepID=UPI001CBBFB96|nr:hypothetical protein [Sutcliffiella horikoshii]